MISRCLLIADDLTGGADTGAQLAVAWVVNQPGITGTIIGPRNLKQFENLLFSVNIKLNDSDFEFCDQLVPQALTCRTILTPPTG
jgi:aryl-alcohol dehydrogenase-like predicted oxidoreductase